jgi:Holliday junction resolvase RusA-like endonuclease
LNAVTFIVPFTPVAWQRAGVTWTNQGTKHFTRPETRAWKQTVATYARSAMRGAVPLNGPLKLELAFLLPIPPSWPNWKREAAERGQIAPTVKPDLDNLEKAVKDAMNKIVWIDDAQVIRCEKEKAFSARPRVVITITTLPLLPAQVSRRPTSGECNAQ